MLAQAWQPDAGREGGLPYGWGASDFAALYWAGMISTSVAFVGLPQRSLASIPYEDVGDILLGAREAGLRADLSDVQRVLRRDGYGSYPRRVWQPLVLGDTREPMLRLVTGGEGGGAPAR